MGIRGLGVWFLKIWGVRGRSIAELSARRKSVRDEIAGCGFQNSGGITVRFEGWLDLGWDLRCVRWGAQGGTRLNLYPGRAQC